MKHLDRLREKTEKSLDRGCQNCQKGGFGSFGSKHPGGSQLFEPPDADPFGSFGSITLEGAEVFSPPPDATIADRYPPDELGEPCPACGGKEKWRWLDSRLLCRACLIRSDALPAEATAAAPPPGRRQPWW
jgi:hypothetical protein